MRLMIVVMFLGFVACSHAIPKPLHITNQEAPTYLLGNIGSAQLFVNGDQGVDQAAMSYLTLLPGAAIAEHIHAESDEMVMVLSGTMEMSMNGNTIHVGPTEVVFIPKTTPHAAKVVSDEKVEAVQVYLSSGPEQRFKKGKLQVLGASSE